MAEAAAAIPLVAGAVSIVAIFPTLLQVWPRPVSLLAYIAKLVHLSQTLLRWRGLIGGLEAGQRDKVAEYAVQIADTLARAAAALARLETDPASVNAARDAIRELGRIAGYIEDIVKALEQHLDGRKLAGVKRRLDQLASKEPLLSAAAGAYARRIERLTEAEGYFRALADGLRA
jgi:chromosome segregation ATPase